MTLWTVKWLLLALLVALGLAVLWLDKVRHDRRTAVAADLLGVVWVALLIFALLVAVTS